MNSASTPPRTLEDVARRLNYFSRQYWHQRRLYDWHNTILRKRIEEQDAELRDAHTRLQEAQRRLQEANTKHCELFDQLQETMAARVVAELKLAGYGLLDRPTTVEIQSKVRVSRPLGTTPRLSSFRRR